MLVFALAAPACSLLAGDLTLPAAPADGLGGDIGGDANATGGLSSSSGGSTNASGGLESGGEASGGQATGGGVATGGGGPLPPALDGPCPKSGLTECDSDNPTQKLVCSKGSWQSNGNCDPGRNCDPASGQCRDILPECEEMEAGDTYCGPNDTVWACGANLVSSSQVDECPGKCVAASASATCVPATCGDGKPQAGEDCDDGNTNNSDDCTELCKAPYCGDGFPNTGDEACDDGDSDNTDGCTELCRAPYCGDGFTNGSEECDDDNDVETDSCTRDCRALTCSEVGSTTVCDWQIAQVAVGSKHACALRHDGRVLCWGANQEGQLGQGDTEHRGDGPDEMGAQLRPVHLRSDARAVYIGAGDAFSCALLDTYTVQCWGSNKFGQLGAGVSDNLGDQPGEMGDKLPEVSLAGKAVGLAVGQFHACALLDNGQVQCWGHNNAGQLGLGDAVARGADPRDMGANLPLVDLGTNAVALSLSAGSLHTCARLAGGAVKCWGISSDGQLGLGTTKSQGDNSGEMGDSLPTVPLGYGDAALSLASGQDFNCALLSDDRFYCWGTNYYGQLGQGDTKPRGDEPYELGPALSPVRLPDKARPAQFAGGAFHTCVVTPDARLYCWGGNDDGQLGLGHQDGVGKTPEEMGDKLTATDVGTNVGVQSVSCGGWNTCVVLTDGTVKCWGRNEFGQLGLGDTESRGAQHDQMGDRLPTVSLW